MTDEEGYHIRYDDTMTASDNGSATGKVSPSSSPRSKAEQLENETATEDPATPIDQLDSASSRGDTPGSDLQNTTSDALDRPVAPEQADFLFALDDADKAFHLKAKSLNVLPLAANRYRIGVLWDHKTPQEAKHEEDFLWFTGHKVSGPQSPCKPSTTDSALWQKTTVETLLHHYKERKMDVEVVPKFGDHTVDKTTQMWTLNNFADNWIVLRAVLPSSPEARPGFKKDVVGTKKLSPKDRAVAVSSGKSKLPAVEKGTAGAASESPILIDD
ncbi:hypothetical protein LTR16_005844 [Cryomyces antarcticus]|uniref:Uncharacterized protein n=1 Tax=Cryomyces antarcticus TaxID=329879 RepID=A0ABR0M6Y5_9PEZI|nr:hypothetical protein LTR04_005861 [Oleoguttula sp. CCFEE 6159]KAK5282380.1 hypothetical protein LTR16_005844 [Cryomyces antarcticus]